MHGIEGKGRIRGVRVERAAWLVACTALLASCMVGPDYKPPTVEMPDKFGGAHAAAPVALAPSAQRALAEQELSAWWSRLQDPELDSLIRRAVAGNLDLSLAAARLREVRALLGFEQARQLPDVNAGSAAERRQRSDTVSGNVPGIDSESNFFQLGLDATWEVDIFGGIRRSVEAARADLDAAAEDERAVLVTLTAEVARTYVEYRSFQQRADVTARSIESQKQSLDLTSSRLRAGLTGELDVAQAQAQLSARRSQLPPLIIGMRGSLHRLSVLLGEHPQALASELEATGPIPTLSGEVPIGLPSELLRRRPDIRRAERRLAATNARIGVATADLFPRFSLNGAFGLESDQIGNLFEADSRAWSIGPAMRWNILSLGRVENRIEAAEEREKQALIAYRQTVLISLEEVEDALVSLEQEQVRNTHLREAAEASRRSVTLSEERYRSGIGDFLDVLVFQQALHDSEVQSVQSDESVTRSLIALYKALGGGWGTSPGAETGEPAPADEVRH